MKRILGVPVEAIWLASLLVIGATVWVSFDRESGRSGSEKHEVVLVPWEDPEAKVVGQEKDEEESEPEGTEGEAGKSQREKIGQAPRSKFRSASATR